MTALCCSRANAQMVYPSTLPGATLIYSNGFGGLGTVNITNQVPDYATNLFGGSTNVPWLDVGGGNGQTNFLYADGTVQSTLGDQWLLPFTPQSGYVYYLSGSVNLNANPGSWVVLGFVEHYQHFAIASAAPNSSAGSIAWTLRNYTGNTEFFGGANTANPVYNAVPSGPINAGSYNYTQVLDTTGSKWVITAFWNGVQIGTPFTYSANPPIAGLGVGQHTETGIPPTYQWTSLTFSATPILNSRSANPFRRTLTWALLSPTRSWSRPARQPTNGSRMAFPSRRSLPMLPLVINPVTLGNAGTNYYVVITNTLGSITSSVTSLTVFTNPVVLSSFPVAYTNPITLFCATNDTGTNYVGSTPTFSVSPLGALPFTYQWQTNGVAVGGATNAAFTLTNCQLNSPTGFACVVSNNYGTATNAWSVVYAQTPEAPYPQGVLASQPLGYWRLNEQPDDGAGDDGVLALDCASGNDGIYTNAYLYPYTYSTITDTNEYTVFFDAVGQQSAVYGIQGINFAAPTNNSVSFSVAAWVNSSGASEANNAGVVAKGYLNAGAVRDGLLGGGKYRFSVHDAAGNLHKRGRGFTVGPEWNLAAHCWCLQ